MILYDAFRAIIAAGGGKHVSGMYPKARYFCLISHCASAFKACKACSHAILLPRVHATCIENFTDDSAAATAAEESRWGAVAQNGFPADVPVRQGASLHFRHMYETHLQVQALQIQLSPLKVSVRSAQTFSSAHAKQTNIF